jgi:ABC-2 type transport system ATP-binding protein
LERVALGDVIDKRVSTYSRGMRQRLGIAEIVMKRAEVAILDEPTSGLDPHQIIETRDLIKGLAGDHTIILSTHILPEVEQICEKVIIIAKGKVVATDSVENLTSRLRGSESVAVEVIAPEGSAVQSRLEQVAGVSRVIHKESKDGRMHFTVESLEGRHIRPGVARAVIEAGWNLNELHGMALSLEAIFLELTASHKEPTAAALKEVVKEDIAEASPAEEESK